MALKDKIGKNKINALLSVIDQGVVSATNFGVAFFLARALSVEEFGLYILLFSVWLFVNNLQIGFINQGQFVLMHSEGNDYKNNMPAVQLFFTLFVFAVLTIIAVPIGFIDVNFSHGTLFTVALVMALKTLKEYARNNALARLKLPLTLFYDTLFLLITIIPVLIAYLNRNASVMTGWYSFGIAAGAVTVLDQIIHRYHIRIETSKIRSVLRTNITLTKWTTLTNILIWGNSNLYKFIVTGYLGLETLAAVGAAQYVTFLLNPILNGMQNFGTAFLSKKKSESDVAYQKSLKAYSVFLVGFVAIVLLPMILVPGFFLDLFYGEKYRGYEFILQAFAFGALVSVFVRLLNTDLMVRKVAKSVFVIYLVSVTITSLVLWGLLAFIGTNGMIIFLLIQNLVILFLTHLERKRLYRLDK